MRDKLNSIEVDELAGLINDFPDKHKSEQAEPLLNEIASRVALIEGNLENFIPNSTYLFPHVFNPIFAQSLHGFLFRDILSNAGVYRSLDDKNNGKVVFGGQKRNEHKSWFTGCPPNKISQELDKSFQQLIKKPADPLEQAIRFYQSFVYINPFYDGNGRIGRIITSIYLQYFGYYVQWKSIEDKSKIINKLNECHKRIGKYTYEVYFSYLLNLSKNMSFPWTS